MNIQLNVETVKSSDEPTTYWVQAMVNGECATYRQFTDTSIERIPFHFRKWAERTYNTEAITLTVNEQMWMDEYLGD